MNNMNRQLQRVINLVKKTGDKLIVVDSNQVDNSAYVVMTIDDYEKILFGINKKQEKAIENLTEKELLDKINRDIALWRAKQEIKEDEDNEILGLDESDDIYGFTDNIDDFDYEDINRDEDIKKFDKHLSEAYNDNHKNKEIQTSNNEQKESNSKVDKKEKKDDKVNKNKAWTIPEEIKKAAKEVVEDDEQYLEEIPF